MTPPDFTPAPADNPLPPLLRWVLAGQLRHILSGLGVFLAAHGAIATDQQAQFISIGTGVALYVTGAGWSLMEKKALTQ